MGPARTDSAPTKVGRLYGIVMAWTIFTSVFAWLPIMRALARPDGYQWRLGPFAGEGHGGSFWVFPLLAIYALALFGHAWWAPRRLFRGLLFAWHAGWTALLVHAAIEAGAAARWQGQGWGFDLPIPWIALVFAAFTAVVAWWAFLDARREAPPARPRWGRKNTLLLLAAAVLGPAAFVLFRAGSDYDGITALAIGATIVQWVLLAEALSESSEPSNPPRASP